MTCFSRRHLLATLGGALPLGLGTPARASAPPAPALRFRPFEESVREAFADLDRSTRGASRRHVEVGPNELVRAGLQGCYNDRPFAGFPAAALRIVRTVSEPGPLAHGVRLYVTRVELAWTGGLATDEPGRPLDFATLPPAPALAAAP